ncbi:spore germination protein [Clostridium sp. C8-1-8]|uniref:spore germination protein n=1 Tax=Clostridium sp. C8-1-8 TaxID=2698831 RepID=UPI00136F31A8|nr:spore germination protein [Clostridium sp. C8-1-8]
MEEVKEIDARIIDYFNETSDGSIIQLDKEITLYFLKTLVGFSEIIDKIQIPYMKNKDTFNLYIQNMSTKIDDSNISEIEYLVSGYVVAKINNTLVAMTGFSSSKSRAISTAIRESSFEGGLESFIEKVDTNINLIRNLYKTDELIVKILTIGKTNKKEVALLYNKANVDTELLTEIRDKILTIEEGTVGALNELQQIIIKGQFIFPRLITTERPDRAINAIDKGKVVILLEGTPVAAISPSSFHEYFTTVDDKYLLPVPSIFLICIRYIALVISIVLPSAYVAFEAYNPEVFRVQLALSIAGSRAGVPYTSYIEVTFMLLMMEFLIEASLRLPKTIGSTATTVGGLILGQAVTEASLASEVMIIIVSAVAISNFVIPTTSMSLSIRVLKYYILFFTVIGGMIGFITGMITTIFYLTSLNSLKNPFFDPANIPLSRIKSIFGKVH